MALSDVIAELITPAILSEGFFLEEVQISNPGSHRIVICVIDGAKPLNLDEVASVSRIISALLDEAPLMGETPFTLEVSSPGVDRPLTLPRHWKKNVRRLIRATMLNGDVITGRLTEFNGESATLVENIKGRAKTHALVLADIKRAVVEIEFNRKEEL